MNPFYGNKVVVITGGSSGIGLALAKEFAAEGAHLVLLGRNADRLKAAGDELSGSASVHLCAIDVADRDAITALLPQIAKTYGSIDVLINSAGMSTYGLFRDQDYADLERCLSVNYLGGLYCAKAAWPFLKASRGQLSFVSSVAGYLGLIGYSAYAPTKFAVTGLAECLRMEGKDDGISVSIIYPPDTDTPMLQHEREHTLDDCKALSGTIKALPAEVVARKYIAGLKSGRFEIYCDTNSRLVRWLKNNFPGLANRVSWGIVNRDRRKRARLAD